MANRHGLIAGATGTGKTITLKVMAEQFSNQGIPVFLADVKGDLASLAQSGIMNPKLQDRITQLKLEPFEFKVFKVRLIVLLEICFGRCHCWVTSLFDAKRSL